MDSNTTRQARDLLAQEYSTLKSTPAEPNKALVLLDGHQEQTRDKHVETLRSELSGDNSSSSSMRDLCKALSKKLSLKQQDKQKDRLEQLLQLVKHSNGEYSVENYSTFDKIVDSQIFSKRIPVSNALIEEVTFKEFAKLYFSSTSQPKQTSFRQIEKDELERRFSLKFMATYSNFRPSKQSLEIQTPIKNEVVLGGSYHDSIYCCEFKLPKMQTKSFILLEGNSVDSNYRFKQFLHVFRIYGDDLFSMHNLNQSRNLCDIIIHFH